jgi:hypothetical protein
MGRSSCQSSRGAANRAGTFAIITVDFEQGAPGHLGADAHVEQSLREWADDQRDGVVCELPQFGASVRIVRLSRRIKRCGGCAVSILLSS